MKLGTSLLILALLALSGFADSLGFFYGSKIWQSGMLSWPNLARSWAGWIVGISLYVIALRPMTTVGVASAELQTMIWFAITIIGVVVCSGRVFSWHRLDQIVALFLIVALGWLLVRTSTS